MYGDIRFTARAQEKSLVKARLFGFKGGSLGRKRSCWGHLRPLHPPPGPSARPVLLSQHPMLVKHPGALAFLCARGAGVQCWGHGYEPGTEQRGLAAILCSPDTDSSVRMVMALRGHTQARIPALPLISCTSLALFHDLSKTRFSCL